MNKRICNRYIRKVSNSIPILGKEKKQFLLQFRQNVFSYADNNPNISINELCTQFGAPEEIGLSFISEMSYQQLFHKLKVSRKIVLGVICTSVIVIIITISAFIAIISYNKEQIPGHIVNTIDITEKTEE